MVSTRSASRSGAAQPARAASPGVTSRRQPAAAKTPTRTATPAAARAPATRSRARRRLSAVEEEAGAAAAAGAGDASREPSAEPSGASAGSASDASAAERSADASVGEEASQDSRPTGAGVLSPAAQRGLRDGQPCEESDAESDSSEGESGDEADPLGGLAASMWQALRSQRLGGAAAARDAAQQPQRSPRGVGRAADAAQDELTWRPTAALPAPLSASEGVSSRAASAAPEPGLNKQLLAPPRDRKLAAEQRKAAQQREWHALPETPLTDEVKRDLRLLRLRGAMDPKRFYKKVEKGRFPTRFAIGTVVEDAADFYSGRLTNKQRKTTLTEELLADGEAGQSRKRRFAALQEERGRWAQRRHTGRKEQRKQKAKRPKH